MAADVFELYKRVIINAATFPGQTFAKKRAPFTFIVFLNMGLKNAGLRALRRVSGLADNRGRCSVDLRAMLVNP